ncbi:MAG: hypothetical protein ACKO0Z_06950 [Betaproteobacteria bacterium]
MTRFLCLTLNDAMTTPVRLAADSVRRYAPSFDGDSTILTLDTGATIAVAQTVSEIDDMLDEADLLLGY